MNIMTILNIMTMLNTSLNSKSPFIIELSIANDALLDKIRITPLREIQRTLVDTDGQ